VLHNGGDEGFESTTTTMETFDNFQFESSSSYGGISVVDDTSSVYTANTQDNLSSIDLSSLSISSDTNGHATHHKIGVEEDFDAVLDDLKDEEAVDLPPHACRYDQASPHTQWT
jgi:regulator of nonsense transcripts 1